MTGSGEPGLTDLVGEWREWAVAALERSEPTLQRWRAEQSEAARDPVAEGPGTPRHSSEDRTACPGCPVCAVLAVLRGEPSVLGARLVEHVAGLAAALRTALHEGTPGADPRAGPVGDRSGDTAGDPAAQDGVVGGSPGRPVHRIRVQREPGC